jgi:hypothetical protein
MSNDATFATDEVTESKVPSKARVWAGRALGGLVVAFMVFDGAMKIVRAAPAVEGTVKMGFSAGSVVGIGVLALACTLLYAIPRTAVLGAVLLTAYLGGAMATHVRIGVEAFPIVFVLAFGALVWGSLRLRDPRVGRLLSRP